MKKLLSPKGFSLIELMVVVAIIGVLASFAIPQYQTFQSKARQKESATLLASFYTAAQASLVELGGYPGNFVTMGWSPAGIVHYRVSSADNATTLPAGAVEETGCVVTSAACNVTITTFKTWSEETSNASFKVIAPSTSAAVADASFTAVASGVIKPGGTIDEWTILQTKVVSNTKVGL